ncbi:beta-glucosidase [Acrasis kona]|uniref:Beta-glucosidase n=1 Tax=Acrasis kona TaxID=1008807 RepID=A0AAW2ZHY8_9EUKA
MTVAQDERKVNDDSERLVEELEDENDIAFVHKKRRRMLPIYACSIVSLSALLILIAVGIAYGVLSWAIPVNQEQLIWDWDNINVKDRYFPEDFLWGTATSAHQVEGYNDNNQWHAFEQGLLWKPESGLPIGDGTVSGKACDHWNLYKKDIQLMKKDLGTNTYRFSIEWSKIEYRKGQYNMSVVQHYHDVIDELLANNISPMVTIHHFTDPLWFVDLGAWEKSENVEHFVSFAKFAFNEYSSKVKLWCTINEPNVYSLAGYTGGGFPPRKNDIPLAMEVMKNFGDGHVAAYRALKQLPNGAESKIGIVHQLGNHDAYNKDSLMDRVITKFANDLSPGIFLSFFSTGIMKFHIPFVVNFNHENKDAINSNDFIGLNYYTRQVEQFTFDSPTLANQYRDRSRNYTDMDWEIYPEGIYRMIKLIDHYNPNIPIIITENGIADAKDRFVKMFYERYLYAVSRAIKEGYNVKGFVAWSLLDNFEWSGGFEPRFGLYHVNYETQERTLKEGSKAFIQAISEWKATHLKA